MSDHVMFRILEDLDVMIIAVRYRLAPKHIYPIPFADCEEVTKYVLEHPDKYGIDPYRVAIAGDSAGGNLAAAVALKLRDHYNELPPVKLQILVYPALQAFDFNTPTYTVTDNECTLSRKLMLSFWLFYFRGNLDYLPTLLRNNHTSADAKRSKIGSYVSHTNLPASLIPEGYTATDMNSGDERVWKSIGGYITNQFICPLMAHDLTNLPRTYLVTAGFDVLRDDGFFYVKRLRENGNDVTHKHYPDTVHGAFSIKGLQVGNQIQSDLIDYVRENL